MPLREFYCESCKHRFERIVSSSVDHSNDPEAGACPKCSSAKNTRVLISHFAVGGQGDLRESTMHGCHDCFTGLSGDDAGDGAGLEHHPDHGVDHDHS